MNPQSVPDFRRVLRAVGWSRFVGRRSRAEVVPERGACTACGGQNSVGNMQYPGNGVITSSVALPALRATLHATVRGVAADSHGVVVKLTTIEKRWFHQLLMATLPDAPGSSVNVPSPAITAGFADDFFRRAPFVSRLGARMAILALQLMAFFRHLRPFSRLGAERQAAFLTALSTSRFYAVREMPLLVKTIGSFAIFGLPEVHESLGVQTHDGTMPDWANAGGTQREEMI